MPIYGIRPGDFAAVNHPLFDPPKRLKGRKKDGTEIQEPPEMFAEREKAYEQFKDVSITVRLNTRDRVRWLAQLSAEADSRVAESTDPDRPKKDRITERQAALRAKTEAARTILAGPPERFDPDDPSHSAIVWAKRPEGFVNLGPMFVSISGLILVYPDGTEIKSSKLSPESREDRALLLDLLEDWDLLELTATRVLGLQDAKRAERFLSGGSAASPAKGGHGSKKRTRRTA